MSADLKERIEKLLRSLGQTPDDVADRLRARRITGVREDGCDCPIARLIKAEIPESRGDWKVPGNEWLVTSGQVGFPGGHVDTPLAVDEFITVFDLGLDLAEDVDDRRPYSDLEEAER